jgi:hypothetical protein
MERRVCLRFWVVMRGVEDFGLSRVRFFFVRLGVNCIRREIDRKGETNS